MSASWDHFEFLQKNTGYNNESDTSSPRPQILFIHHVRSTNVLGTPTQAALLILIWIFRMIVKVHPHLDIQIYIDLLLALATGN